VALRVTLLGFLTARAAEDVACVREVNGFADQRVKFYKLFADR
jgi:hypothetical protein